jgi:molybdopterin synthase catalytic subunit
VVKFFLVFLIFYLTILGFNEKIFFSSSVIIQKNDIDINNEINLLKCNDNYKRSNKIGAITTFLGTVRDVNDGDKIISMFIEHYPEMTEESIYEILKNTRKKWPILNARVVHRVGLLTPGENIVFVGVGSSHRKASFEACEYIMDYLKTQAPFWKREETSSGTRWVQAKTQDEIQAKKWETRT